MVQKWNVQIPELSGQMERCVYVYLPDSYEKQVEKRYPVMYMFDGHNVFFDSDATYGKSWGMKEYMDRTQKQLIIVAVGCNPEGNCRLQEYAPIDFDIPQLGQIRGRGATYMNWLLNTLKPNIDSHYRTLTDRANTMICGSSMGGLMALFAACAYHNKFSKAACLSPSLWTNPDDILELISRPSVYKDTCIYMDYGSAELSNHAGIEEILISTSQTLQAKGANVTLRIVPGGTHCEASWEKQIPIFMEWLGL